MTLSPYGVLVAVYTSLMRFEVPQFIEIEDRIFGPFTWRQFLYLGGGVGMGVVLFLTTPLFVFLLVGIPLATIALALAFYPINNRPFSFFLEAIFSYYRNHRLYLWRRSEGMVYKEQRMTGAVLGTTIPTVKPIRRTSINTLARKLEMQALQKQE